MSPKKPDFDWKEWSRKLEAGERGDPVLDLAARLKEDRPNTSRPDPTFKASLRARLVDGYEKPGVAKSFWNWAVYGLALIVLVGVLALAMELLPGRSFPEAGGPDQMPESNRPANGLSSPTEIAPATHTPEMAPSVLPTPLGGSGRLAFNYFPQRLEEKNANASGGLRGYQDVFTANPDGSDLKPLIDGPEDVNTLLSFSPDGKRALIFSHPNWTPPAGEHTIPDSEEYGSLYVVNVNGSDVVKLTDGFRDLRPGGYGGYTTAYWLLDSQGVVYIATDDQGVGIFRIEADGSRRERLTSPAEIPLWLLPSPDENGVYWEDGRIEGNDITQGDFHRTAFDGTGTKPVWENLKDLGRLGRPEHIQAAISPNGKWIAFIKRDCPDWGAEGDICQALNIADTQGNLQTAMYYIGSRPVAFTWAPDGEHILVNVLVKNEKGYGQTFSWWGLAGPDLKLPEELEIWTQDGYPMGPLPQWSPDGTQILFENPTWPLPKILDLRRLLDPKVTTALEALRPEAGVSGPYWVTWAPAQR